MQGTKSRKVSKGTDTNLTALMRAAIEARDRLARARKRLREIEKKLRGTNKGVYEKQRNKAISDYIEAANKAQQARTMLLKQLRERTA